MPTPGYRLRELVARDADGSVDGQVDRAVRALLDGCETARACGVLFYGAGAWRGIDRDTILDFYLLVDDPRAAGQGALASVLNRLLPPNVFYLETSGEPDGTAPVRAKVAVITLAGFRRGARGRSASPLVWARFAQPCRLVYARDQAARTAILDALADCVVTFHRKSLPLVPAQLTAADLWIRGLEETYARELRSETARRARAIVAAAAPNLVARTRAALPATGVPARMDDIGMLATEIGRARRWRAWLAARLARPIGKLLSLARLIKAAFTFRGGIDYICTKIERHSGVRVAPTALQRRHPLIAGWPLLWKIYRRGGFR